jgi:hypothetical protein
LCVETQTSHVTHTVGPHVVHAQAEQNESISEDWFGCLNRLSASFLQQLQLPLIFYPRGYHNSLFVLTYTNNSPVLSSFQLEMKNLSYSIIFILYAEANEEIATLSLHEKTQNLRLPSSHCSYNASLGFACSFNSFQAEHNE